jgi:hypothetical protein
VTHALTFHILRDTCSYFNILYDIQTLNICYCCRNIFERCFLLVGGKELIFTITNANYVRKVLLYGQSRLHHCGNLAQFANSLVSAIVKINFECVQLKWGGDRYVDCERVSNAAMRLCGTYIYSFHFLCIETGMWKLIAAHRAFSTSSVSVLWGLEWRPRHISAHTDDTSDSNSIG